VTGSVSASISASIVAVQLGPAKKRVLKTFAIDESIPDWNLIKEEKVKVFKYALPKSLRDILKPLPAPTMKYSKVKISSSPFGEGAARIASYMLDTKYQETLSVAKEFKYVGPEANSKERYMAEMEIQTVASKLAHEFNKLTPVKEVKFVMTKLYHLYERENPIWFTSEPFIAGQYVKFNSNTGYVNDKQYHATLDAFSHFTYEYSNHYLIVVGLPGVHFCLTDPAIHCKDLMKYGNTNLGVPGINMFFETHICNAICKTMKLPVHSRSPHGMKERKSETVENLRR